MSKRQAERTAAPKWNPASGGDGLRIDAPHAAPDAHMPEVPADPAQAESETPEGADAPRVTGQGLLEAASLAQQLHVQASQLADQLAARQKDLDHREAELNARSAELEAEIRSARLWISQEKAELEAERSALAERQRAAELEVAQHRAAIEEDLRRRVQAVELREAAIREEVQARARQLEEDFQSRVAELERQQQEALADLQLRREALENEFLERFAKVRQREQAIEARWEDAQAALAESQKEWQCKLAEVQAAREGFDQQRQHAETELQRRLSEVRTEAQRVQAEAEALAQARAELQRQQAELDHRRQDLEEEIREARRLASEPSPELLARERRVEEMGRLLDARQEWLEQAEARVADLLAEAEKTHAELLARRQQQEEDLQAQRQEIEAQHRRELAELNEKYLALGRLSEHLEHRRAAIRQMREEVERLHRDALEMRLAAEELASRLLGETARQDLGQALSDLRARLADQYRQKELDLARQRDELQMLRAELNQQYQRVIREREAWEQWAVQRQEQLDRLAAELLQRQEELDRRQAEQEALWFRVQAERLEACRGDRPSQTAAA